MFSPVIEAAHEPLRKREKISYPQLTPQVPLISELLQIRIAYIATHYF